MASSFEVVEIKLQEAEFFLDLLRSTTRNSFAAKFYFSAFVSAARSVTLAMQSSMAGVEGFADWYASARENLKCDALAPHFVEIRNDVIHRGVNPLDRVTPIVLRDELARQFQGDRSHVLVLPLPEARLVDAGRACADYFESLVNVVFDCYQSFKRVVDPRWYFTEEAFTARGLSLKDAVLELGFPVGWLNCAPTGSGAWRSLRAGQPACQVNAVFKRWLGLAIRDPEDPEVDDAAQ